MDSKKTYSQLIDKYEQLKNDCEKVINKISNFRLVTFIAGLICSVLAYSRELYLFSLVSILMFGVLFVIFIVKHQKFIERKKYNEALLEINKKSLKRAEGSWHEFEDDGKQYIDKNHKYSYDLDVFGKSSLFQWLNATVTSIGDKKFADIFLNPLKSASEILKRQEAILELSKKLEWRQNFIAEGIVVSKKTNNIEDIVNWTNEPVKLINSKTKVFLIRIIPILIMSILFFTFVFSIIPYFVAIGLIVVSTSGMFINNLFVSKKFAEFSKYKDDMLIYSKMLDLLENEDFESELLKQQINQLKTNHDTAHSQMKKLVKISDMIEIRRNMFYIIINGLFLWDFQCLIAYEKWKNQSGRKVEDWLNVIGLFEAFSSLSNAYFDKSDWATPEFYTNENEITGEELGHPLLDNSRVCNDMAVDKNENVLLITGSNMSGKSTFLRTVGVNLLISYVGLPVCAKQFKCCIMEIYTCMRVSDDLSQNISSFYAELLRIKKIIDDLDSENTIFFLLDEIFKGTNSADRHIGASNLIKRLSESNTMGLVSTHDLELGELEDISKGRIKNYHFEEYYENDKIRFDYKLREGLSNTRNAVYLMRIIGLDV